MLAGLVWYLSLAIFGIVGLPLVRLLLPGLQTRSYAFARITGLLLTGYIYWLFVSFKVLANDLTGILTAILFVGGVGYLLVHTNPLKEIQRLWAADKRHLLSVELFILVTFVAVAFLRAANPDIRGTEKPMELAFINSILRSPSFPPDDPWLAGYSISYYYFGYVLTAILIRVSGVTSGVSFNLMVATVFSLAGGGLYALALCVLEKINIPGRDKTVNNCQDTWLALLAPIFTLVVSNFEGVLEFLHVRGTFWKVGADGMLVSRFWSWLDIQELTASPAQPFLNWPSRPAGILWWRASRVLSDYNLSGNRLEIIDEFPFFSFLLADLHPHVLMLPVATLILAITLSLLLSSKGHSFQIAVLKIPSSPVAFLITVVVVGSVAFLNTWELPIYLVLYIAAIFMSSFLDQGWKPALKQAISAGLLLVPGILLAYLPFIVSFSSQAGGVLPSMIYVSRGAHFWVMFGPLLIPLGLFFLFAWFSNSEIRSNARKVVLPVLLFFAGLILLSLGTGAYLANSSTWASSMPGGLAYYFSRLGYVFTIAQGASPETASSLWIEAWNRRLSMPGTWITLFLIVTAGLSILIFSASSWKKEQHSSAHPALIFLAFLVIGGGAITAFPEFFYLRDQFGWRMNTIFKFYYQAWMLWSLAAAICAAVLWRSIKGIAGVLAKALIVIVILGGLAYPILSIPDTIGGVKIYGLELDGTEYFRRSNSAEKAGIEWLSSAPRGTVLEAVGGSYSGYARVSTMSGQPAVLGWPGHESQWRGGYEEMGNRMVDIETIYTTDDWSAAQALLDQYHIRYIFVSDLERSTYQVNEDKLSARLGVVFQQQGVTIYEYNGGE
jgi:YYY domain-containing protein